MISGYSVRSLSGSVIHITPLKASAGIVLAVLGEVVDEVCLADDVPALIGERSQLAAVEKFIDFVLPEGRPLGDLCGREYVGTFPEQVFKLLSVILHFGIKFFIHSQSILSAICP